MLEFVLSRDIWWWLLRYLVDGVWQHDPLYPTESDENGNINNKIVVLATPPAPSQESQSQTLQHVRNADDAVDDVSIQEQADNIYRRAEGNQGDLPTGEKARTDTASVNCQGKSKCWT